VDEPTTTSRRGFLKRLGMTSAGLLALACQPTPAAAPTAAPAKPTEAAKPAASPAAKPTASPAAAAAPSVAATPPPGPIEAVVAAGAGGSSDVLMRRIGEILTREQLVSQTLLVQPRPGGSGAVGYQYVIEKKGDPNILGFLGQSFVTTPIARGVNPPYFEQLQVIAHLVYADLIVCCAANSRYQTLADLVDYAKKNPQQVKLGGAQVGSTDHIVASKIDQATGTQITYVGFAAGAEAIPQTLGGTIDLVVLNPDEAAPMAEAGQIRMLAILTEQRVKAEEVKDVPTAREQGVDVVYDQVWGLAVPPGLAPGVVAWWDQVTAKLVQSEAWKDFVEENVFREYYLNSAQAPAFFKQKHEEHVKIMTDLGLAS
jgi:putative tricarboxylic transport membrane protein